MDMKKKLEVLAEELVEKYQFRKIKLAGSVCQDRSTEPIERFLVWLENTPEAVEILDRKK